VNVLVDTSIWSLALRRKAQDLNPAERAAVAELTNLIREGRARIIGLVRQELLSGIKTTSQYEKLRSAPSSVPSPMNPSPPPTMKPPPKPATTAAPVESPSPFPTS
jgi:hypothetical protein